MHAYSNACTRARVCVCEWVRICWYFVCVRFWFWLSLASFQFREHEFRLLCKCKHYNTKLVCYLNICCLKFSIKGMPYKWIQRNSQNIFYICINIDRQYLGCAACMDECVCVCSFGSNITIHHLYNWLFSSHRSLSFSLYVCFWQENAYRRARH